MYIITGEFIIKVLCFVLVFKSKIIIAYLKKHFYFEEYINEFINFYIFICENNPLLLDCSDEQNISLVQNVEVVEVIEVVEEKKVQKFEDKYLDKFKKFTNNFYFTDIELEQQNEEQNKIKTEYLKNRNDLININQQKLMIINIIQTKGDIDHTKDKFTENMNDFGINLLVILFDMLEEYEEDSVNFDLEELYSDLLTLKEDLLKEMEVIEKNVMTDEDFLQKARDVIINKKLDKYVNNYILEFTPLGNVFMRYNNDKKSFEYFSNNSIPYRYLEPLARKYVMTYWCKPIFVDMEEELKKSEEKYEQEQEKQKQEYGKLEDTKSNPRKLLAQLKSYNKDTRDTTTKPMKNRTNHNVTLPPQIKANLPDVNKPVEKQLLKEKANRYTWEGRLTDFCPLKKIDRKILDKKLAMTYADFKKMQQK